MSRFSRGVAASLVALAAITLLSCGRPPQTVADAASAETQIRGAGATFPQPLYARWIAEYRKQEPDVTFSYEGVGSGEGIRRFIAEEVDFGASDAAMKDSEIAQVDRGVQLLPMTGGMVVLAYNLPGFGGELNLPREVYVDIFLGRITRWDDARIAAANPNAVLPARSIQTVARRDSSGTTFAFTNHLASISASWRDGPGAAKQIDWPGATATANGNEGVAQKINITQYSIGYIEYGFAQRLGLPMARLENRSGVYVAPSARSGQSALADTSNTASDDLRLYIPDPEGKDAYPIVTYTWLLVYQHYPDAAKAAALKAALRWGLDGGQTIAEQMGYIPLPENVLARTKAAANSIN